MNTTARTGLAFSLTAPYYDGMYGGRDIPGDVRHILRLARRPGGPAPKSLLDLGCGTGIHAVEFSRHGLHVTGVDRSAQMIAEAKRRTAAAGASVTFVTDDILRYVPNRTFDVVVSMFDVLSYLTENDQVGRFFSLVSRALSPGGSFVFDFWYGPGVFLAGPKIIRQRYAVHGATISRKKTPVISYEQNTVAIHHELIVTEPGGRRRVLKEVHPMRYFFLPEIREYARGAGLEIAEWGTLDYPLRRPKIPPWSICVSGKKRR